MAELGQDYKIEMIDDLVRDEHVETVSLYRQGDFVDMCRGPHLPDTGRLKAFKLISTAGAYWRGDEKNKMLTRIYGIGVLRQASSSTSTSTASRRPASATTACSASSSGCSLITDAVGPGLPLWMPKGAIIRMELEGWLRGELLKRGYQPVITPHIGKLDLYRTSGHYPYYEHGLFPPMADGRGRRLPAQADELPAPHPDLQGRAAQLPRPAVRLASSARSTASSSPASSAG